MILLCCHQGTNDSTRVSLVLQNIIHGVEGEQVRQVTAVSHKVRTFDNGKIPDQKG